MIGGLLESVDFPFSLPMGDLSRVVPGREAALKGASENGEVRPDSAVDLEKLQ